MIHHIALVFVLFQVLTSGCASARDAAILTANSAREVEISGGAELHARCTDRYRTAPPPPIEELDAKCLPARAAYDLLRTARLALLSALARDDADEIAAAVLEVGRATEAVVRASRGLP